MMYFVLLALFFVSFSLLAFTLITIAWPKKTVLSEQLGFYEQSWHMAHGEHKREEIDPSAGLKQRYKQLAVRLAKDRPFVNFIKRRLEMSGVAMDWSEFLFYHVSFVVAVGAVGYLLDGIAVAVIAVLIGSWLPLGLLSYLSGRRQAEFGRQLPEVLTMISASLKAGYSLLQAVDMVAQEITPPMSEEFSRVLSDARLGLSVEDALEKMSARICSTNFDWMLLAIKIQREVGGNLAEVLGTLGKTIREREALTRQIKVLTAEGRLSAIILLGLPVLVFISLYFLNRGYITPLFTTTSGMMMFAVAIGLMGLGTFWLNRIVKIEV
jgi:tight adherence protein B